MLFSAVGKQIPATSMNIADITTRELKCFTAPHCHDLFRLSTRVTFKGSQKAGWESTKVLG